MLRTHFRSIVTTVLLVVAAACMTSVSVAEPISQSDLGMPAGSAPQPPQMKELTDAGNLLRQGDIAGR